MRACVIVPAGGGAATGISPGVKVCPADPERKRENISKHFLPKWHSWRCVVKGILKGRSNSLPFCGLGTGGWRPEERVLDPFDGEAVARGMVYYE
eukprot:1180755-Prorocentrum_minimum.AAC.8